MRGLLRVVFSDPLVHTDVSFRFENFVECGYADNGIAYVCPLSFLWYCVEIRRRGVI